MYGQSMPSAHARYLACRLSVLPSVAAKDGRHHERRGEGVVGHEDNARRSSV